MATEQRKNVKITILVIVLVLALALLGGCESKPVEEVAEAAEKAVLTAATEGEQGGAGQNGSGNATYNAEAEETYCNAYDLVMSYISELEDIGHTVEDILKNKNELKLIALLEESFLSQLPTNLEDARKDYYNWMAIVHPDGYAEQGYDIKLDDPIDSSTDSIPSQPSTENQTQSQSGQTQNQNTSGNTGSSRSNIHPDYAQYYSHTEPDGRVIYNDGTTDFYLIGNYRRDIYTWGGMTEEEAAALDKWAEENGVMVGGTYFGKTEPATKTAEEIAQESDRPYYKLIDGKAHVYDRDSGTFVEVPPAENITTETPPVESEPVENTPVESTPVETPPAESEPVVNTPVESAPVETPVESTPVESTSADNVGEAAPQSDAPIEDIAPQSEAPADTEAPQDNVE